MTAKEEQIQRVANAIGMSVGEIIPRMESLRGSPEEIILKALFSDRINILFQEHLRKLRKADDNFQKEQGFLDGLDAANTQINEKL